MTAPLSLLYVDDDVDIGTIVQMALRLDPTISFRTAASGAEALRIVRDTEWLPDVIVLDVIMPDMGGLELLSLLRVRPHLRDLPVVFMTAKGRDADLATYKKIGAQGIILKPFDPLGLAVRLRAILGH